MDNLEIKTQSEESGSTAEYESESPNIDASKKKRSILGIGILLISVLILLFLMTAGSSKIINSKKLNSYSSSVYSNKLVFETLLLGETLEETDYDTWTRIVKSVTQVHSGVWQEYPEDQMIGITDGAMTIFISFDNYDNQLSRISISSNSTDKDVANTYAVILIDSANNYSFQGMQFDNKSNLVKEQQFEDEGQFTQFVNYLTDPI